MTAAVLDVEMVEKLQRATAKSITLDEHIAAFTSATLSGLVEYGCLRHTHPDLPNLPSAIVQSELGHALGEVCSPLGLRRIGLQKVPPSLMSAQRYEFIVLDNDEDMTGSRWIEFGSRFALSVHRIGFRRQKALEISAAMGEMADNAVLHSESTDGILIGYQAVENFAACIIADVGIGILKSLRSNQRYKHLRKHADAIETALRPGESKYGYGMGGTGFSNVFKTMAEARGTMRFRSGEAFLAIDGQEEHTDEAIHHSVAFRPGFQVTICCRSSARPVGEKLI